MPGDKTDTGPRFGVVARGFVTTLKGGLGLESVPPNCRRARKCVFRLPTGESWRELAALGDVDYTVGVRRLKRAASTPTIPKPHNASDEGSGTGTI